LNLAIGDSGKRSQHVDSGFTIMLSNMWLAMLFAAVVLAGPAFPDDLPRGVGHWDPKTLGNHRIVIEVSAIDSKSRAVRVHIPWRRRDKHPSEVETVVTDSAGIPIQNVYRKEINREYGDIAFEAKAGPGDYYLYHLPHVTHGTYYPSVTYTHPAETADASWMHAVSAMDWETLPEGRAERFESVSEFDAFTPMEVIATHQEVESLLGQHPKEVFLVFPEDRHLSIRMWDDIPYQWEARGANTPFVGTARRGEYYTFQLGVWAARANLKSVKVRFSDLNSSANSKSIPTTAFTCYNTTGVDYRGNAFSIDLGVVKGRVQPLWCGIDIPADAKPGAYSGAANVSAEGAGEIRIPLNLTIDNTVAKDRGDDHPEDMTRLRWLNSRLGEDHQIVKPYRTDGPLASSIILSDNGFFAQIGRGISSRMDRYSRSKSKLLAAPIRLCIEQDAGVVEETVVKKPKKRRIGEDGYAWNQTSAIGPIDKHLHGSIEFDGTSDFQVELTSTEDCSLKDIRLEIPLMADVARYFMGLGRDGGTAPESLDWKWSVENNQEGAWVGNVNCGLSFALRDERYVRPLNTNFYHEKPLILPSSWDNGGKGGIRVRTEGGVTKITCYSGPRTMRKGETVHFNVHMMLTPFKLIDPKRQFSERYYHAFKPLADIQNDGANVVNVHHATEINPWINYPFLGYGKQGPSAKMKTYIDDAHRRGMKVKIYDTIRELTNRTPELFMLKSLGHEVFSGGKGGGGSWLREHLDDDYISAWHATEVGDAAIVDSGMSRWHNYYIEGLDWLARNVGIDGLYLDDVAFDRVTMKRVRKVLERRISERDPASSPVIDLHSANQHNPTDGWNNSAYLYMDLMPFLDRLWFGEYFDYNKGPDYWLTEISGIPFGLMGEMLQGGGNPWRGMLFGMTARRPWSGDPRPLWKLWDEFGIKDAEMIGWWADDCPVTTGNKDVPATVYVNRGSHSALISIASWAKTPVSTDLRINWKALGLSPKKATLIANPIDGFQSAHEFKPGASIPVEPGKGWLLILSES
jgi:hypothetical protein